MKSKISFHKNDKNIKTEKTVADEIADDFGELEGVTGKSIIHLFEWLSKCTKYQCGRQ